MYGEYFSRKKLYNLYLKLWFLMFDKGFEKMLVAEKRLGNLSTF